MEKLNLITDQPINEGKKSKNDGLGFKTYASVLGKAAVETTGPFTIGIFGEWGTGKTSLMRMIEDYVRNHQAKSKVVTVWFNAWRYEKEEHPIVPLIATIVRALDKERELLQVFKDGGKSLIKALRAVAYGFAVKSKVKVPGFSEIEASFVAKDMIDRYENMAPDPLLDRSLYYEAFEQLSAVNQERKIKIIVSIDDLDRCFPDQAIKLLESIKLVLSQPGFIFVLGVARSVIEGYLQHRYEKEYGLKNFKGQGYLDKIVQLPFHIPPHKERMEEFSHLLLEQNGDPEAKTFKDILPIVAAASGSNPRSTIRFVNNLLIDKAIAKSDQGMESIPIGYFAISRSLQLHWQDTYKLLVSSNKLCSTISHWKQEDIGKFVTSKDKNVANAARSLISDPDLKALLYSHHGREWLANEIMRNATLEFLLKQRPEATEDVYQPNKVDIYICYNQNDVHPASKIAQFLYKYGMKVLMDIRINPGEDQSKIIHTTLTNAEYVIILIGLDTLNHPWPMPAVEDIIIPLSEKGMIRIVPVLLDGCDQNRIPEFLKPYRPIFLKDLKKVTLDNQLGHLIKGGKTYTDG